MQSQSISIIPPVGPKNYVFVDEHNRHKRLKVMRACEGCRRRKIKCDSATTNSWPCAACTRLKLHCVPPVGGVDGEVATGGSFMANEGAIDYRNYGAPRTGMVPDMHSRQLDFSSSFHSDDDNTLSLYTTNSASYQKPNYVSLDDSYGNFYAGQNYFASGVGDTYQDEPSSYMPTRSASDTQVQGLTLTTPIDQLTAEDLSQHLGELKIGETGIAPYIRQQKKDNGEPDGPILEPEMKIAAFSTDAGSQIRIPPALMPEQDEALRYFQGFFKDIHPYVPVLIRSQFYHQWHTDKASISPLILEAVFACAGRMSDDPAQGAQWLALANQHEACFLDSPRLSTLQALLILLKARESAPKKGYYYRSWMTCKTVVSMAKDLELHEHHEIHTAGDDCGSDPVECLTKTRIWQTILICETMVAGPQGRTDLGVDPNSIDISPTPPNGDLDDYERSISRQYAYFVRNTRNIRLISDMARGLKKKKKEKDWALDQAFGFHNAAFNRWPDELPEDLRVKIPADGTALNISSHFIANMHSHYHLGVVMLRRPQLTASQTFAMDAAWKNHMSVSYNSAKTHCCLQEAILVKYGLTGLLSMQRGINFTIYSTLTCVMVHLIAITSPLPEYNTDAREFFVRHMRILEQCVSAWPMQETEDQINGLRAAFSADMTKPFELKASFPHGTPSPSHKDEPDQQQLFTTSSQSYLPQHMTQVSNSYLATPPVSSISNDSKPHSPQFHSNYGLESSNFPGLSTSNYYQHVPTTEVQAQWNPTPIIDQFANAFQIPPSALAPPSSGYGSSPPGSLGAVPGSFTSNTSPPNESPSFNPSSYPQQQQQQQQQRQYHPHQQQQIYHDKKPSAVVPSQQQSTAAYPQVAGVFVTPKEWQDSVASVFDPSGLKRRWDYAAAQHGTIGAMEEPMNKRR